MGGYTMQQQSIVWSDMSNTEIRMKMSSLEEEYEAVKNKINNLLNTLDYLDEVYLKGRKELERRTKNG